MKKIKTIFERDWNGNRGVMDKYAIDPAILEEAIPTEKLDGTNVRMTVRNHMIVRLEKRRNPTKVEKQKGIEEPWYVDASEFEAQDKHIWDAARNTDLKAIEDGEWSGEAVGPDVQGNPLNLDKNIVALFSAGMVPAFSGVPIEFNELKEWLNNAKSIYGKDAPIEGIVWHAPNGEMYKIKRKDFK